MLRDTLFPVKEVPAIGKFPKNMNYTDEETKTTGWKFILREDTGQILSCMTNEYKMVTNKQIIDIAKPVLKKHKAELVEAVSLGDGQKTVWKWRIPDYTIKIAEGDDLNPEIIIKNSYDGSLQVHILAGAFRLVCSNGMVIGITLGQKNYRHSVNNINLNKDKIESVIEKTINHTMDVGKEFEILANTKLNEKHIIKLVELFPFQMSEYLVQYLVANKPTNYWDLLNTSTYLSTHKMKREYQSTHKLETDIYPKIKKWAETAAKA